MTITDLIQNGESSTLEFKSTLRVDLKTGKQEKFIEYSVLKTLAAFLNSAGGTLLIGIDDNKNILGLDKDFKSFPKGDKLDEFQKYFDNIFGNNIGNRFQRYIKVEFPEIDGKMICSVTIKEKSEEEVYITNDGGQEIFYIRRQASTISLKPSDAVKYIKEHWKTTKSASLNDGFIEPLNMFSSKEIFQKEMNRLLTDRGSIYYQAIKEHWNSYLIFDDGNFLSEIAKKQLYHSIDYGLLHLISDFVRKHLHYDKDVKYIYNHPHIHLHNQEDEGFEMPLYYHIRFIGLLYSTAIDDRVDIDSPSNHYRNMNSIYSGMIKGMIENIKVEENSEVEPTNYHWLISQIFFLIHYCLESFNEKEHFIEKSSYAEYFPKNLRDCFSELYIGEKQGKISKEFISDKFYECILKKYFSPVFNNFLRSSFERNIILNIPKEFIESILKFSLNAEYTITIAQFYENNFYIANKPEKEILDRLREFLITHKKI